MSFYTTFEFETKVEMVSNVNQQIAGIMAWNGSNATTGVPAVQFHEWPNNAQERASFQIFNTATPGITGDLNVTEMWLKLRWDKDAGAGGLNQWTSFYSTSDPTTGSWTQLATYDSDYNASRLGLFLKGGNGTPRAANFSYAALSAAVPEPTTFTLLLTSLCSLLFFRGRRALAKS